MLTKIIIVSVLLICVHYSCTMQENGYTNAKEIGNVLNRIERSVALDYNTRSIPPTVQRGDRIVVTVPEQRQNGYPSYPTSYRNNKAPTVIINVPDENYSYNSAGYNRPYAGVPPVSL